MEVYKDLKKIKKISNCFLTMGTFDGCHLGHQELFKSISDQAIQSNDAQALITYYPHPRNILKKADGLKSLMSLEEKLKIFETYGFDYVLIISFNNSFANVTASDFLNNIVLNYFNPQKIIIGYDHHFGKNREGTSSFLKNFSKNFNFNVEVLDPVKYEDKTVSSSLIRELIINGEVSLASDYLNRFYGFDAIVVSGSGRGSSLGFPTANFIPVEKNQLIPMSGVYFISGTINSNNYYGMCNLGYRPTFNGEQFVMEAHFFEFPRKDIYNKKIKIEFLDRLRDERKFSNTKELTEHIKKDKKTCIDLMQKYKRIHDDIN